MQAALTTSAFVFVHWSHFRIAFGLMEGSYADTHSKSPKQPPVPLRLVLRVSIISSILLYSLLSLQSRQSQIPADRVFRRVLFISFCFGREAGGGIDDV